MVVGLVIAVLVETVLQHLHDPVLENSLVLLLPFVTYAAAEELGRDGYHGSGVLAVVAAGLYLGHRSPRRLTAATRLQGTEVWRVIEFLLESVVFALIGLQLPTVLDQLPEGSAGSVLVGLRGRAGGDDRVPVRLDVPGDVPAADAAERRRRTRRCRGRYPTVLAWAGMRGVVSLAAAFALPADFPQRSLILFLTFVVVVGTLLIQGLTLPALIRWLGVTGTEEQQDLIREAGAQHAAANAALARLDEELANSAFVPEDVVSRLREKAEIRQLGAWERLGGRGTPDGVGDRAAVRLVPPAAPVHDRRRAGGVHRPARPRPDRRRGAGPGAARAGPRGVDPDAGVAGRTARLGRGRVRRRGETFGEDAGSPR